MNIAYFNYEWDLEASTGSATQIVRTAAGLERLGHRVAVFDLHRQPPQRSGSAPRRGWAHSWLWDPANHWRSLRGIGREIAILRERRPDILLIFHALRFSGIVAARRLGIPVVLQVNASVCDEFRRFRPEVRILPGVSDWIERRTLCAADGMFVVSNILRDYLACRGVPADRMTVIPNGADPETFSPDAADPALRLRFPSRILIGFAGSFAPFHGIRLLPEVIRRVAHARPDAHFVLAGDGPAAAGLRAELDRLHCGDSVTFLGRLPHEAVPGVLAAMDILIAPYTAQGWFYFSPLKLFEYMACGRAVVAPRLGQIGDIIQDGHNGALYDPRSPGSFAVTLVNLLADPGQRARFGRAARQTILKNYTWDHNARRVEQLLLESVRRRKSVAARAAAQSF